jgi:NAD(P)-dependent dehydrogenase (short-subunit alcohol dehydrogenase family)
MNITNKTVLVTGANRGIGQALVNEALRRGAKRVYAAARSPQPNADKRVTPLTLDVTRVAQIQPAAAEVETLDILINNAGVANYDDLTNLDAMEAHLAVNLFGTWNVTRAFLPLLTRSKGAIVNNLSLAAVAPLPMIPAYSISKAAASNMTQSLRALLADEGVTVHAVFLGPVDTDMTRGFEVPKASPESVAQGIFDGLEKGEEDIFPDPASAPLAEGWRTGAAKALERQFAAFLPQKNPSFAATFLVDKTPEEVFNAITNVRGWWSGEIEGETGKLGAEFIYRYKDVHRSKQKITEFNPGKKIVWHVLDASLSFTKDKGEWKDTDVVFEISEKEGKTEVRFTHLGLVPQFECYSNCSNAWGLLINGNLRKLIGTGKVQPDPFT